MRLLLLKRCKRLRYTAHRLQLRTKQRSVYLDLFSIWLIVYKLLTPMNLLVMDAGEESTRMLGAGGHGARSH